MIWDALFGLLFGLINFVVGLFPSWTPPTISGATGVATTLGNYAAVGARFIDIAMLVDVVEALIAAFATAVAVKAIVFIYHLIPGIG